MWAKIQKNGKINDELDKTVQEMKSNEIKKQIQGKTYKMQTFVKPHFIKLKSEFIHETK